MRLAKDMDIVNNRIEKELFYKFLKPLQTVMKQKSFILIFYPKTSKEVLGVRL